MPEPSEDCISEPEGTRHSNCDCGIQQGKDAPRTCAQARWGGLHASAGRHRFRFFLLPPETLNVPLPTGRQIGKLLAVCEPRVDISAPPSGPRNFPGQALAGQRLEKLRSHLFCRSLAAQPPEPSVRAPPGGTEGTGRLPLGQQPTEQMGRIARDVMSHVHQPHRGAREQVSTEVVWWRRVISGC